MSILPSCLTVLLVFATLGVHGVLFQIRNNLNTQIQMDRCVRSVSLALVSTLNEVESLNEQIGRLRKMAAMASMQPAALSASRATITSLVALQTVKLASWKLKVTSWAGRLGCTKFSDKLSVLPQLPARRLPPDWLGPQPLIWLWSPHENFQITLGRKNRSSGALTRKENRKWKSRWFLPLQNQGQILIEALSWSVLFTLALLFSIKLFQTHFAAYQRDVLAYRSLSIPN